MHFIQKSGPVGTDWLRPAAKGPLKPKMPGHQNQLSALQCHEWVKINHLEPLPSNNWKSCQSLHPLTIMLLCQLCLLSCALSTHQRFLLAPLRDLPSKKWVWVNTYRYIFSGMNIHLPVILMFTRYQGFDPSPNIIHKNIQK